MPFSYSQLQTYRRCPRQYEYAFIKKLKRPISAGESFGASVHNTLKKWGELEMKIKPNPADAREDQLKLFLHDAPTETHAELTWDTLQKLWHASFIIEGYVSRVEADFKLQTGERLLRNFYDWWASSQRQVTAVETGFSWTLTDGTQLTGRLDRVERTPQGIVVIDFKTGSPRTQHEVDADLQLSLYALAVREKWGEPANELILLFLSEDHIVDVRTKRSPGQLIDAQKSIAHIIERISSGDMHPTPAREKCASCPYRTVCDVAAA